MTTKLRAHFDGKVLVPTGKLNLPAGQEVELQLKTLDSSETSTSKSILEALQSTPPVSREDVDELERLIDKDKISVNDRGVFDES